ncbi:MAG: fasciclin domain-containing protein [Anaerolineales bacterium]
MNRIAALLILSLLLVSLPLVGAQDEDDAEMAPTIADLVSENEDFSTLLTALEAAELAETLGEEGPFTVFAPTNEAFEAIPEDDLNALLDDPEALSAVLLYHVLEGEAFAEDVLELDGEAVETLNGAMILVTIVEEDEDVMVMLNESAQVTEADVEASNGVIHVIDTVLMPPAEDDMAMADEGMDETDDMADAEETVEIDFSDPEAVTLGLIEIFFQAETPDDFLQYVCEGQEDSALIPDQNLLDSFEGIEVDTSELELEVVENEDGSVDVLPGGNIILVIGGQEQNLPASLLAQQVGLDSIRLVEDDDGNWLACPEDEE